MLKIAGLLICTSLLFTACATPKKGKRKIASQNFGRTIKTISADNNEMIQSFRRYHQLSNEEQRRILRRLERTKDLLLEYEIGNDYSYEQEYSFNIENVSRKSGGKTYRIKLTPNVDLAKVSVRARGGKLKIYSAKLVFSSGESIKVRGLSSRDSFLYANQEDSGPVDSQNQASELHIKAEAWGDNISLNVSVFSEDMTRLSLKRNQRFNCHNNSLYEYSSYVKSYDRLESCNDAARDLNKGIKYRCEKRELYEGLSFVKNYSTHRSCSSAKNDLNNGVRYRCEEADLYDGFRLHKRLHSYERCLRMRDGMRARGY